MTDGLFFEQYRKHAANCFHVRGLKRVIDGCLPDGPPLAGCDIGEALHRLAIRKQDQIQSGVCLREMLHPPHPRASYR